jgi:hypothetical protein
MAKEAETCCVDDTTCFKVLKFMLYYNWILNIDDKELHENTAKASEVSWLMMP